MSETRIDFASLQWEETAAGVRSKSIVREGKKLRLVEFTREFVEREWCVKAHAGYVLEGEFEISFSNRAERFTVGDGIFITGGEQERHKLRVLSATVRLLLAEEA